MKGLRSSPRPGGDQVIKLLGDIAKMKGQGVTGGSVVYSWMHCQVQPLQKREHPGFRYQGPSDPSRFSVEKLGGFDAFKRVCRVLEDVHKIPYVPKQLFNIYNRHEDSGVSTRSLHSSSFLLLSVSLKFVVSFCRLIATCMEACLHCLLLRKLPVLHAISAWAGTW